MRPSGARAGARCRPAAGSPFPTARTAPRRPRMQSRPQSHRARGGRSAAAAPGTRWRRGTWSARARRRCLRKPPRGDPRRASSPSRELSPPLAIPPGPDRVFDKSLAIVADPHDSRRMHDRVRRRGSPPSLLIAADRLRLLRRAGRVSGARRGRDGDREHPARREREPRGSVSHRPAGRVDPRPLEGRRGPFLQLQPGRGRVRREHDDAQLRAQPRVRARAEGRGRDHRHAARPRRQRRTVGGARRRPRPRRAPRRHQRRQHARPRRPRVEAVGSHARRLVPVGVERDRHDRRRASRVRARPRRRRDRLGRRRALRRPRGDGRARDRRRRRAVLAVQVLRPAPRHGVRPRVARRDLAPVQGAAVRDDPDGAPLRDRHAALRAARRAARDVRLPRRHRRAWTRSARTSDRSASASSPA